MMGQDLRDLRQHARLIGNLEVQVERRDEVLNDLEVADRPGVLAQVAQALALHDVSVKSVVQKGLGDEARLVMVLHPVLESRFGAAMEEIASLEVLRRPPRAIRVLEEEFG